MRCLSIQQPWAWAICAGFKRVENRTWKSPYRGPVAIVASAKESRANDAVRNFTGGRLPANTLAFSAIIGTAVLVDIVPLSAAVEDDPFAYGPLCWVFDRPVWFQKPIPTTAKLRLYESTAAESRRVDEAAGTNRALDRAEYGLFAKSLEGDPLVRILDQADQYMAEERWDDVRRAADRAFAVDPKAALGPYLQANMSFSEKRFQDALTECNRAIKLDPNWVDLYLGRKSIYEKLGDLQAAEADYARALELDPSIADEKADEGEEE